MITESLPIIHPGEILKLDFLEPMNITPYRLSVDIGVAQTRMSEIINGKRGISADTAIRLSRYFSNSAQFWLNLQAGYDLRLAQAENQAVYDRIPTASGVS
jgi:addiction module HigA family antidote